MKSTVNLLIFVITLLAVAASAYAQSPREELQQMVEQLQKTPNDNALREKIIKLTQEVMPSPAIPEEANRSFVRGNVFQKEAKDASGYELAISAYRVALRVAPWWGDAYFNLAVALESANKFDEAIASLKLYIASVPGGSVEAREAQNRIYAIEAKSEMASKQAAITARAADGEPLLASLEGAMFECVNPNSFDRYELGGGWLRFRRIHRTTHQVLIGFDYRLTGKTTTRVEQTNSSMDRTRTFVDNDLKIVLTPESVSQWYNDSLAQECSRRR